MAVLILQIVTIVVSISSVVVNVLLTKSESRKEHYLRITTEQRREVFKNNRSNQATVVALCLPECILEKKANNCNFKNELAEKISNIMYSYKLIYKEEQEIILEAENLMKCAYRFYDEPSEENKQKLLSELSVFYHLTSIYDIADWRFLKEQSIGKEVNSCDFDVILHSTSEEYNKSKDISVF